MNLSGEFLHSGKNNVGGSGGSHSGNIIATAPDVFRFVLPDYFLVECFKEWSSDA